MPHCFTAFDQEVLKLSEDHGSPRLFVKMVTAFTAHKTGRRAYLCELNPIYCDRIIRRWEAYAKDDAEQLACGLDLGTSFREAAE